VAQYSVRLAYRTHSCVRYESHVTSLSSIYFAVLRASDKGSIVGSELFFFFICMTQYEICICSGLCSCPY